MKDISERDGVGSGCGSGKHVCNRTHTADCNTATIQIGESLRQRIEEHHRASNRTLAMEYWLPLAVYGYAA